MIISCVLLVIQQHYVGVMLYYKLKKTHKEDWINAILNICDYSKRYGSVSLIQNFL